MFSIISCLSRKVMMETNMALLIKNEYNNRYFGEYVDDINNINCMLKREYKNNNLELTCSNKGSGNVYDLVKGDDNVDFYTKNEPNSWIQASFKDGKSFHLKKYMIKGSKLRDNEHQLQSWKLEGKTKNNNLILLDQHENEPFKNLQLRAFNINFTEPLTSIKLTQTGKNTYGNNYLEINSFDIFGYLE